MKSKGQEEMVGFVVIIVLVAVIALVMLGIVLRNKPAISSSTEVYSLIESMMEVTTDCSLDSNSDARIRDLFEPCTRGDSCYGNGISTCAALNDSVNITLGNALYKLNQTNPNYIFEVRLISNSSNSLGSPIMFKYSGNCSGKDTSGALYPLPAEFGRIDVSLKIC